jgi:hypothetical protein
MERPYRTATPETTPFLLVDKKRGLQCYTCCNFKQDQRHATDAAASHIEPVTLNFDITPDTNFYELVATLDLGFELRKQ